MRSKMKEIEETKIRGREKTLMTMMKIRNKREDENEELLEREQLYERGREGEGKRRKRGREREERKQHERKAMCMTWWRGNMSKRRMGNGREILQKGKGIG